MLVATCLYVVRNVLKLECRIIKKSVYSVKRNSQNQKCIFLKSLDIIALLKLYRITVTFCSRLKALVSNISYNRIYFLEFITTLVIDVSHLSCDVFTFKK